MTTLFIKIYNWIAIDINIFYSIYLITKSEEWHKKKYKKKTNDNNSNNYNTTF